MEHEASTLETEHDDNDDCAKYDPDHWVKIDGENVAVRRLQVGDVFAESWGGGAWIVESTTTMEDEEIHLVIAEADSSAL